jgi:hypothetical protein
VAVGVEDFDSVEVPGETLLHPTSAMTWTLHSLANCCALCPCDSRKVPAGRSPASRTGATGKPKSPGVERITLDIGTYNKCRNPHQGGMGMDGYDHI